MTVRMSVNSSGKLLNCVGNFSGEDYRYCYLLGINEIEKQPKGYRFGGDGSNQLVFLTPRLFKSIFT